MARIKEKKALFVLIIAVAVIALLVSMYSLRGAREGQVTAGRPGSIEMPSVDERLATLQKLSSGTSKGNVSSSQRLTILRALHVQ